MDILYETIRYSLISVGCIGAFTAFILLVSSKYDYALYLNILLLSIAFIEPAPSDIIFVFLILFMCKGRPSGTIDTNKSINMMAPLYLFLFVNIISLFNLVNIMSAVEYLTITTYVIVYALYIFSCSDMKNYKGIFNAYIASSTTAALIGIAGYLFKIPILTVYEFSRAKALFKDPNVFGPFLVPAIVLLLSSLKIDSLSKPRKWIYIAVIIINSAALLISFSRGAYVNFIVALIIYLSFSYKEIHMKRLIACAIALVLVFSILWVAVLDTDFKGFLAHRVKLQSYDLSRFEAQRSGLSFALGSVFGYGPGQYGPTVERVMDSEYAAHSLYIRVMLENGIVGFITLIGFFSVVILYIFKICIHKVGREREIGIVILSILCGILINSIVVDTLHWRHFWLFVGLGISLISGINKETLNINTIK